MQYVAETWTWIKAVEPAWWSAGASLVAAIFASGLVTSYGETYAAAVLPSLLC